ncbi:hypothetical protein N658DRAFT_331516 [Parathielavia hyrcaniae]|uniref:Uncharacterized protein n=1 Tax=Parathielavia hyrcaniae TaxID=113614 RepID=A0AAN6Q8S6_9PEZI|nr:hypothetical protein N658DRAFT_331516 [Parathielavia hyrcaniae]
MVSRTDPLPRQPSSANLTSDVRGWPHFMVIPACPLPKPQPGQPLRRRGVVQTLIWCAARSLAEGLCSSCFLFLHTKILPSSTISLRCMYVLCDVCGHPFASQLHSLSFCSHSSTQRPCATPMAAKDLRFCNDPTRLDVPRHVTTGRRSQNTSSKTVC